MSSAKRVSNQEAKPADSDKSCKYKQVRELGESPTSNKNVEFEMKIWNMEFQVGFCGRNLGSGTIMIGPPAGPFVAALLRMTAHDDLCSLRCCLGGNGRKRTKAVTLCGRCLQQERVFLLDREKD